MRDNRKNVSVRPTRNYTRLAALCLLFLSSISNSRAQVSDSTKQNQVYAIGKRLAIDKAKAAQVWAATSAYKTGVKQLLANKSLSEGAKQDSIGSLARAKKSKLGTLLTPEQLVVFDPSSPKDLRSRKHQPPSKEEIAVRDTFERSLKAVFQDKNLSEKDKQAKASALVRARNKSILVIRGKQAAPFEPNHSAQPR